MEERQNAFLFDVVILEMPTVEDALNSALPKFLLKPTTVIATDRSSAVAVAMVKGNVLKKIEKRAAKAKNGKYDSHRIRPMVRHFFNRLPFEDLNANVQSKETSAKKEAKKATPKKATTKKAPVKKTPVKETSTSEKHMHI